MKEPKDLTLGQKIKNFRKRSGMSQLELENEIGAAHGAVSRMEKGKINPTKETIHQLAKALNLSENELSDLLDVRNLFPSEEEIEEAVNEIKEYFSREDVLAYLLDEWGFLHAFSKGFANLLHVTEEFGKELIGRNLLEIIIDPEFQIIQTLDPDFIETTQIVETARTRLEIGGQDHILFEELKHIPNFKRIWDKAGKLNRDQVYSAENKYVYFKIGEKRVKMLFVREAIKTNKRFDIIEYIPQDK